MLKNKFAKFLCLFLTGIGIAGCATLYEPYGSQEPAATDSVSQTSSVSGSVSEAGQTQTQGHSVSGQAVTDSSILNEVPPSVYEQDRQDLGLTDENYQVLHEEMTGCYAYETLSVPEKLWYLDMYQIIGGMKEEVALYDGYFEQLGIADIDKVFQCVLNDHPEFFYINGYTYTHYTQGEETVRITFSGTYTMDLEEAQVRREQIDAYAEECLAGLPQDAGEYEKTKYVYEYLISHTEYNLNAPENQNICSVFIGRQSVCQGYAKATQYLLEKAGVFATLVVGQVNGGQGHAWNLVRIDGNYYYVDTTWGDASYQSEGADAELNLGASINYDYLCVTTEQLLKTHTISNIVTVPLCRNMEANYYVREGAYFTAYDEAALQDVFDKGYAQGKKDVTLKCSSSAVYQTMLDKLITGQEIFRYLKDSAESIAYAGNDVQLSLTFWLSAE